MLSKTIAWGLTLLYGLTLTILSFISFGSDALPDLIHGDKVFHFCAHFGIATLTYILAYKYQKPQPILWGLCVSFFYGIVIEVLQETLTVDRHFDYYDIIANSSGALIAMVLVRVNRRTIVKYL